MLKAYHVYSIQDALVVFATNAKEAKKIGRKDLIYDRFFDVKSRRRAEWDQHLDKTRSASHVEKRYRVRSLCNCVTWSRV